MKFSIIFLLAAIVVIDTEKCRARYFLIDIDEGKFFLFSYVSSTNRYFIINFDIVQKFVFKYFRFVDYVEYPIHLSQNKCPPKPCSSSGSSVECKTNSSDGIDENGCGHHVCWSNGFCGLLML